MGKSLGKYVVETWMKNETSESGKFPVSKKY